MGRFEILEHTADIGVVAYGPSLKEAFAAAAEGLFSLITDLDSVKETLSREITIGSPDEESLLVDWLNELIYLFDAESLLFRRFDIARLEPSRLEAMVYGEKVDPSRHELHLGVKATTYHMLKIEKDHGYRVQVIFDI